MIAFATASMADSVTVDLSNVANGSWCSVGGGAMFGCSALPTGQQTFNGESFNIANGASGNAWFSSVAAGNVAGTTSVTIQMNVTNAVSVKTLMNTFWGQGGTSYDTIQFNGSKGSFSESLTGNNTLRDYNNYVWTNSINQPTTVAWSDGSQRLDEQEFSLGAYAGENLTSITITDTGDQVFSRAFLAALTVDMGATTEAAVTPEPAYLAVVGASFLGLGLLFRRKRA
jgi:hypothetical protein